MTPEDRHLFYSLRVGGLALKNRIFSSGHAEAMAEEPGTLTKAILVAPRGRDCVECHRTARISSTCGVTVEIR
jgi:hypothetical protein